MAMRLKLSTKVLLVGIIIISFFTIFLFGWLFPNFDKIVHNLAYLKCRHLVESAYGVVEYYSKQARTNVISVEEAQKKAMDTIRNLRYEKDDYFWIHTLEPRMLMHPTNLEMEGMELSDYKDANGKRFIVDMNNIVKLKGAGFEEYMWAKPGTTKAIVKISYVKLYPAWGWVIGTGVYEEDVKEQSQVDQLMFVFIIIVLVSIVGGITFSVLMARSITKPLNRTIKSMTEGSQQVSSASFQLSASSQQLSEGSAEQASAIEETSSTLEESTAMIQQNTENTKQAASLSKQVRDSSDKGNLEMQQMMNSMDELKKSSTQIAKIIKVIDEIAFQTNILALNAAIEAARAGEAGAGFAVVAEEVRNLAQRSAQAAKDTATIIESNIELSDKGTVVAEAVKNSLGEITLQTKKVSELMEEVSAASQEQYQGIEEVNKAIAQVEVVTQQNSATAEESAAAAEELNAQAQSIMEIVGELSSIITGKEIVQNELQQTHKIKHLDQKLMHPTVVNHNQTQNRTLSHYSQNGQPRIVSAIEKEESHTKIISPEDVIPLEKDKF